MQGTSTMERTKSAEGAQAVIDDRRRRRDALQQEMRTLAKHKKRIKARLRDNLDWPTEARTGGRADVDHEDVRAPLPDDLKTPIGNVDEKMQMLRAEAAGLQSFTAETDPGVRLRRRAQREAEARHLETVRGNTWTDEMVEARLTEAFRTLARTVVGRVGPREFGNAMPTPVRAYSDMVNQAGNKSLRRSLERLARKEGPPTSEEVRRMEDAIMWATLYLRDEYPDLAMFANLGGMWKAWEDNISKRCRELGIHRQVFYRDRKVAIKMIAEGLKRDGKAPT
jgi:hypothetical protein